MISEAVQTGRSSLGVELPPKKLTQPEMGLMLTYHKWLQHSTDHLLQHWIQYQNIHRSQQVQAETLNTDAQGLIFTINSFV